MAVAILVPLAHGANAGAQADDHHRLPGALAHTPADAPLVISLQNPRATIDRAIALLGEMPGDGAVQARAILSTATVAMFLPGLDATDSLAIAVYPPAPGPDGEPNPDAFPAAFIIAPVSNYNALRGGLGLVERDGVAELNLAMLGAGAGGSLLVRDIPGPYVACALDRATLDLANFDASVPENAWTTHLGTPGVSPASGAAAASDLSILINPKAASDAFAGLGGLDMLQLPGIGGIPGNGAGHNAGNGAGDDGRNDAAIGTAMNMITAIMDAMTADGTAAVFGITLTDDDIAIESGGRFAPGSDTSNRLTADANDTTPDAGAVLSWLPEGPALLNAAADLTHAPTRRTVLDWLGQLAAADPFVGAMLPSGAGDADGGAPYLGHAVHLGLSPAALGGAGILGQGAAITRVTNNPREELDSRFARLRTFDGREQGGVALAFSASDDNDLGEALGARDTSTFRLRASVANGAGPEANSTMDNASRLHGRSGGPNGLIARRDDAVVVTTGRSSSFLSNIGDALGRVKAPEADTPEANNSALLAPVNAAAGKLPANPGALMTVDLDAARTLAGEFAPLLLAPYGGRNAELGTLVGALQTGDGGVRFQLRVPRKTAIILGDLMLSQMGQVGQGGGNPFAP